MSTTTAFLTDSTLCIGCKACEVACKEWNGIAEDGFNWTGNSYDNTGAVGHSTWRHVKFVEGSPEPGLRRQRSGELASWGFSSDVCKHCENAGCLEACPTGAIVRTEFGGVFVQPDVCNGCAYCVVACPFGVVQRNPEDGRAFKCTFCYDRQKVGLKPACAHGVSHGVHQVRPAGAAASRCRRNGSKSCRPAAWTMRNSTIRTDTSVGGIHAFFIVRGDPRQYNLPPNPEVPTIYMKAGWTSSAVAAGLLLFGSLFAFLGSAKR